MRGEPTTILPLAINENHPARDRIHNCQNRQAQNLILYYRIAPAYQTACDLLHSVCRDEGYCGLILGQSWATRTCLSRSSSSEPKAAPIMNLVDRTACKNFGQVGKQLSGALGVAKSLLLLKRFKPRRMKSVVDPLDTSRATKPVCGLHIGATIDRPTRDSPTKCTRWRVGSSQFVEV